MRKIKFRFWSGYKMFYGVEEVMACLVQQIAFDAGLKFPIPYDHIGLHGASFMQFTGLLDKNGKEIYEGDIIKWAFVNTGELDDDDVYYTEVVEWNDCGFFLEGGAPLTVAIDDCEVIGNIHQNPELL